MLARIQRVIAFGLVIGAVAWIGVCLYIQRPSLAAVGPLTIVAGYAAFLALEFALMRFVQDDRAAPLPKPLQLMGAWAAETITAPRVFCWRQPFRSGAEADFLPDVGATGPGVVLVHGFFCNRGIWNPWMRRLRAAAVPFVAVNLEPPFASIDAYGGIIEAAAARVERCTGRPVVFVGHSMGGLVIRSWLARAGNLSRTHRVMTIATPHRGTWLARWAQTANGREMRAENGWLKNLSAREAPASRALFTCFFGHCDNIVFPAGCGTLDGATNLHLAGTAHVEMAFREVVMRTLFRIIDEARATGGPPVVR